MVDMKPVGEKPWLHAIRDGESALFFEADTMRVFRARDSILNEPRQFEDVLDVFDRDLRPDIAETIRSKVDDGAVRDFRDKDVKPGRHYVVSITDRCNLRCRYCFRLPKLSQRQMSEDTARRVAERIIFDAEADGAADHKIEVIFFGGEPLMNFTAIRTIVETLEASAIAPERLAYSLSTNGTIYKGPVRAFFEEHQFSVQFSIDGNPEVQGQQRPFVNGRSSADAVDRNLDRYGRFVNQGSVRMTVTRQEPHFSTAIKDFHQKGFGRIAVGFDFSGPDETRLTANDMDVLRQETRKTFAWIAERTREGNLPLVNPFLELLTHLHRRTSQYACGAMYNIVAADCGGELYPCQRFLGDEPYKIGNAATGVDAASVRALEEDEGFVPIPPICQGCWARNLCGGMCQFLGGQDDMKKDYPFHCQFQRMIMEEAIRAYAHMNESGIDLVRYASMRHGGAQPAVAS